LRFSAHALSDITPAEMFQRKIVFQQTASRLIRFLKLLADKYQIPLWGHARPYEPDPPHPAGRLLTKEELDNFYRKHGFKLSEIDSCISDIKYVPKKLTSSSKA
jgi:hypothetical protein